MSYLSECSKVVGQEIVQTLQRVDYGDVQRAADVLDDAHRVFVVGIGREGLAARGLAMRLSHLGIETHWAWDDTTPAILPGDAVVMVNGSGEIGHLDYVFERMKEAGAVTIVVTGCPDRDTPMKADICLFVPATVYKGEGDLVATIQPMGSLFEQCVGIVFDLLVLELAQLKDISFAAMAARHRNFE